ncbi:hypothetical protein HPP92_018814 [Vanilla planifolia]|uniref:Transmembrane 9 superfamily member n=1 Tax=Vanilla planifolia TaxID=51239 RepID=A0A835UL37_VANPL|nr:hypothetical protein HPP92_018814 [Vanilla planifolia]
MLALTRFLSLLASGIAVVMLAAAPAFGSESDHKASCNLVFLSALVGTGAQLSMLILLVIVLAIIGMLYVGRGAIQTTFILCYAFTSFISGFFSGGLYSRNGGKNWIKAMILTASLFPFLCFGIGFALNTIAIFYRSLAAIPFGTMVVVFVIWAFISFPLALLGTVAGKLGVVL